jgi:hypothetical protein
MLPYYHLFFILQEEGTLMGTAFGVCFTYWIGGAMFIWVLSYISNVHIALLQIMSMMVSRFIILF